MCRDCSKTQWYHCSKCYDSYSGDIRAFCNDCSKIGCWGDPEADRPHGTRTLTPHYFRSAEVVEFSDSEEESDGSDGSDDGDDGEESEESDDGEGSDGEDSYCSGNALGVPLEYKPQKRLTDFGFR